MVRHFRPRLGRLALHSPSPGFFILSLPAIFFLAGISACAPKETVDTWKVTPPTLETTNSRGLRVSFQAGDLTATKFSESTIFDETSTIKFAPQDRGLSLRVASECRDANGESVGRNSDPILEHKTTTNTSEAVSLLGLLPPTALSPQALKKQWNCSFKMSVMNEHGSRSDGVLRNLKIQNSHAMESSQVFLKSTARLSKVLRRRLACPNWWAETSEPAISVHSSAEDGADVALQEAAHAERVHGIDSRPWERRPVCSVIETRSAGLKEVTVIEGIFQPSYKAPRLSWTREFLLPTGKYENLMNRPVVQWTLRNAESTTQTVFIPSVASDLRMATRLYFNEVLSWTKPLRAEAVFTQSGGIESRTTSKGFYVRVAAGGVAHVVLHSGRGPYIVAMAEFGLPKGATHLMLSTKSPMTLESLANEADVGSLSTITEADLDTQPKDLGRETDTALIDTVVLAASPTQPNLVETALTKSAALAMGPSVDAAIVINLTPNENFREITD